ncbi:DUF262 domain-containing protein [uncultured Microbacterium sp.]|uniref:DUF262 domain-containing protein n=1 Tax=uncultured Microbacterium sp. TaxID=191216 RepID=UPI0025F6DF5F|nr:DUF262 domain-containing protein [uncultured Microbacterium sp.]
MTIDSTDYDSDAAADEVFLIPFQGESEEDAAPPAGGFNASVSGTDWTVETLVNQMRKGRIDLDPTFQRRNAWLANRKSKLVESIILGFPIPQIVLAEKPGQRGQYFVLDGKQRLLALRQYFALPDDNRDADFDPLILSGLEVLSELNGTDVGDLETQRPESFSALENSTIRTVVLSNWNSESLLLSLFLRLNTGSVALSPQELRQALIPGEFMQWIDRTSGASPEIQKLLGISHPDRRMVDAELLLRHIAFSQSPLQYRGNLKAFLDDTSRTFTADWSLVAPGLRDEYDDFRAGLAVGESLFGSRFCRKWTGPNEGRAEGKWERALNRAVFDFQAYSLSFPSVRDAIADNADNVLAAYREKCESDEAFVRSISATTKTADAFITRHRVWRSLVEEVADVTYELPGSLRRD